MPNIGLQWAGVGGVSVRMVVRGDRHRRRSARRTGMFDIAERPMSESQERLDMLEERDGDAGGNLEVGGQVLVLLVMLVGKLRRAIVRLMMMMMWRVVA